MIKIKGLNYKNGCGGRYLFGYSDGDGNGKGIRFNYFNNFPVNGWGDGYNFGDGFGDGVSTSSNFSKREFLKND